MSGAHFAIVHTDAEPQPFHVVIIGGNGEPILAGENLATEADAMVAVCAVAAMFGWDDARLVHLDLSTERRWVVDSGGTWDRKVEVRKVDQRAGSEPPC